MCSSQVTASSPVAHLSPPQTQYPFPRYSDLINLRTKEARTERRAGEPLASEMRTQLLGGGMTLKSFQLVKKRNSLPVTTFSLKGTWQEIKVSEEGEKNDQVSTCHKPPTQRLKSYFEQEKGRIRREMYIFPPAIAQL